MTKTSNDDVLLEIDANGTAFVTLNRAEVHNAFNENVIACLRTIFTQINDDDHVRAVILSGKGKSFSAGADLNWMKKAAHFSKQENINDAVALSDMLDTINRSSKPVIAVAHGAVMGGGVGLLACSDMVIAAQDTRFALSEVKLGLTPATISPYVIHAIGPRHARRYFLSGERFDCTSAHQIGLVHTIAEDASSALNSAIAYAQNYQIAAPSAVADAKSLVRDLAGQPITDALRLDTAERIATRRISEEGREGLQAFLDKRKPNWASLKPKKN